MGLDDAQQSTLSPIQGGHRRLAKDHHLGQRDLRKFLVRTDASPRLLLDCEPQKSLPTTCSDQPKSPQTQ